MSPSEDLLVLVDEHDCQTGIAAKSAAHRGHGQRHRAFSLFLLRPDSRVYHATYEDVGSEHEVCSVFLATLALPKLEPNPIELDGFNRCTPEEINTLTTQNPEHCAPWLVLKWPRVQPLLLLARAG